MPRPDSVPQHPGLNRHSIFNQKPCIPAMFMIQERKLNSTHQEMFRECIKKITSLKNAQCPIVIDKEKAIIKAIQVELPGTPLLLCWNHRFRDVRTWCHKHGAQSSDITICYRSEKAFSYENTGAI